MAWWKEDAAELGHVLRVLVKHTIYLSVAIGCMRFIEWLIVMLFGNAQAFDLMPMGWPFLAGDLGMAIAFYYYAFREIRKIFNEP